MDELHLPPAPPAGDDVRARVLARVIGELDQAPPRRERHWLVPVAAAVAGVLVVGGAVLVTSGQPGLTQSADPAAQVLPPTGDPVKDGFLARCAAAVASSGHAGDYPDPSSWTDPSFLIGSGEFVASVGGTFFCNGTPTTVFLSRSSGTPVGSASVVRVSPAWAGVVNPDAATIYSTSATWADDQDGRTVFVPLPRAVGSAPVTPVEITAVEVDGRTARTTVGPQDDPLVVVDRPTPAQDRSSPDGQLLAGCLASPSGTLARDPDAYVPLPRFTFVDGTVVVPTYASGAAAFCTAAGDDRLLSPITNTYPVGQGEMLLLLTTPLYTTLEPPIPPPDARPSASVLVVDARATRIEVTDGAPAVRCDVVNGAALCMSTGSGLRGTYTAYGADGTVVAGPVVLP